MVTDTKIDEAIFFTHHTESFSQTITGSSYRRNYVQNRPWGELVRDDLTSEEYLEYEALFKKKLADMILILVWNFVKQSILAIELEMVDKTY